ncbi:MAG: TetM/TetW/TetO/TetS family tetracycline resistance ribosomal protection protein [Bacteroidales bacterium]|nr:TetM/TetW/TetO/TetS family tetracycline resistance ribosomal protection protein [Bacteroidales bacterium]
MINKIKNIAILAHVDAGKTTITENFLYLSGAKRSLGNVDKGSATTDSLEIEKLRGISVRSASVSFIFENTLINLIDTPGHVDFSSEVESVFSILDSAILVISAIEGVQAHTYSLWNALKSAKIPTLIFINKIDREGVDLSFMQEEIINELNIKAFILQQVDFKSNNEFYILDIFKYKDKFPDIFEQNIETIAEFNDKLLNDYLNSIPIFDERLKTLIFENTTQNNITPVLFGSAKNSIGINELLSAVNQYIPFANIEENNELSAIIFKIEYDKKLGKLAHVRVFSGKLQSRQIVFNFSQNNEEKISQIKKQYINKLEDINEILSGDIGIVSGLSNAKVGDILGKPNDKIKSTSLNIALLTVQVKAVNEHDYASLGAALEELNFEYNQLNFNWLKSEKEFHLKVMGAVQIEILQAILKERFNIETEFSEPTVIYKETPAKTNEGFVRYWMPKPCWAILKFKIEAGERNSGIVYQSKVSVNDIQKKYQNEIEKTIPKALQQGIKGWELTDIKITLIEGEDHVMHSNPGDFVVATPMAIMNGLTNCGTTLLEPIFEFEISADEEFLGKIASDLTNMRAEFANPEFENGKFRLKGKIPASTSINYSIKLSSITGGKGKIRFNFSGYKECSDELGEIRAYKGINPLDQSKWILHARGAYKTNE